LPPTAEQIRESHDDALDGLDLSVWYAAGIGSYESSPFLDVSWRLTFTIPDISNAPPHLLIPYVLAFLPLALSAAAYSCILLRCTAGHLEAKTHAGGIDVSLCFHINEYMSTCRGRTLQVATRALAYLAVIILIAGSPLYEALFFRAMPQLIVALIGTASLFPSSCGGISHDEYRRVAHTASALRPAAYQPPLWRRTFVKTTLQVVELEAMRAYEALAASPNVEETFMGETRMGPDSLLTA